MINCVQSPKVLMCKKHTQPIIAYQQAQPFCSTCLVEQAGVVSVDLFNQQIEAILLKQNQTNQEQYQLLQSLWDSLINFKNEMNNKLDKIMLVMKEQIKQIDTSSQQFQKVIDQNQNQQTLIGLLEKEFDTQQENNKSVRAQIENLLQAFCQKFSKMNSIFDVFKQKKVLNNQDLVKQINIEVNNEKQMNNDKYQYELIEKFTDKEDNQCTAFAFNKVNNTLAVACHKYIIIYEFINGKLQKELQRLDCHKTWICCLHFMKQSNCLVSGEGDGQIIIWNLDKNNQWFAQQELMEHQRYYQVLCIVMNKKEDLLISGSNDKTIIFWRTQNSRWQCNQTINMNYEVQALSQNESQNKLISCGCTNLISIMEQQQNDLKWIIIQKIDVSEYGIRLCFTIGNQFVFQPATLKYLEVYDYNQINNKFQKLSQIEIQSCNNCHWLFPCQYIKQLNILTVKHGGFLNVFQVNKDGNYKIIQTIKYEEQLSLYGCLSDDGQYLVTWDIISKTIQVRELKQIK